MNTKNDDGDVMRWLIEVYEKVEEDGWAEVRNMVFASTKVSRPTFYSRLKRVQHLWEKKKNGVIVLVRPITNWREHILDLDEKYYFSTGSFAILSDSFREVNKIEEAFNRLSKLHELMIMVGIAEEYEGAYTDFQNKITAIKKSLNEFEVVIE
jgi:predicted amino acid racemase